MFNILEKIFGNFTIYKKEIKNIDNSVNIISISQNNELQNNYLKENNYVEIKNIDNMNKIFNKFFWTWARAYGFKQINFIILSENESLSKKIMMKIINDLNKKAFNEHPQNGEKQFKIPDKLQQDMESNFLNRIREMKKQSQSFFILEIMECNQKNY